MKIKQAVPRILNFAEFVSHWDHFMEENSLVNLTDPPKSLWVRYNLKLWEPNMMVLLVSIHWDLETANTREFIDCLIFLTHNEHLLLHGFVSQKSLMSCLLRIAITNTFAVVHSTHLTHQKHHEALKVEYFLP